MRSIRVVLLLVLGVIGSLAGAQAQPNAPLRVGFQTGDINVQLMYAVNTDLFAKRKIDAKLTPFPAGPAMLPALAAAEIDIAWMGEFPVVTGYSNGMGIEIFMMERIDTTNVRLVANAATGVQTVADLKGRKIGVSVGSTSHHHLLRALAQAGLKQDEVTLVNLAPANMPPAYLAGQIDAALTWEPNIGLIEKSAGKTIATTESLKMITGGVWVVRSAFAKDNPETMQRFLAAWADAMAAYRADPRNTRQYEAKRVSLSADEFDALIARQNARHPSFEELLTADFMGPPGKELELAPDEAPAGHRRLPGGREAHHGAAERLVEDPQYPADPGVSREQEMTAPRSDHMECEKCGLIRFRASARSSKDGCRPGCGPAASSTRPVSSAAIR